MIQNNNIKGMIVFGAKQSVRGNVRGEGSDASQTVDMKREDTVKDTNTNILHFSGSRPFGTHFKRRVYIQGKCSSERVEGELYKFEGVVVMVGHKNA